MLHAMQLVAQVTSPGGNCAQRRIFFVCDAACCTSHKSGWQLRAAQKKFLCAMQLVAQVQVANARKAGEKFAI